MSETQRIGMLKVVGNRVGSKYGGVNEILIDVDVDVCVCSETSE